MKEKEETPDEREERCFNDAEKHLELYNRFEPIVSEQMKRYVGLGPREKNFAFDYFMDGMIYMEEENAKLKAEIEQLKIRIFQT